MDTVITQSTACNACGREIGNTTTVYMEGGVCKRCAAKSIWKDLFFKTVAPAAIASFLFFMAYLPLSASNSGMDLYLKMLFFAGVPFGLKRMCTFIVPFGHDLAATVGIFALNFIVGGIIGAFVLAWKLIYAVFNLIRSVVMLARISRIPA